MNKASVLLIAIIMLITAASAIANTSEEKVLTTKAPKTLGFCVQTEQTSTVKGIIWDNGGPDATSNGLSSQLDVVYPINSQCADDFLFEEETVVSDVHWWGTFWNGPPDEVDPCDFNIFIYADDGTGNSPTGAGMPNPETTAIASYFFPAITGYPLDPLGNYEYEVILDPVFTAEAGEKYWITIQAVFVFPPQWGWLTNGANPELLHTSLQGFPLLGTDFWTDHTYGDMAFYLTNDEAEPLIADAHGPYEAEVGEDIQFTGSAEGGVPPYTYEWDFGNGDTSDEQNPTYSYDAAGEYDVVLTVTDSQKEVATDETTATISEPPPPPIELELTISGGLGATLTIENTGETDAEDIDCSLAITGGILGAIDILVEDTFDIASGETATLSSGLFLGLGGIEIEASAGDEDADAEGTQLIIFTMIS